MQERINEVTRPRRKAGHRDQLIEQALASNPRSPSQLQAIAPRAAPRDRGERGQDPREP